MILTLVIILNGVDENDDMDSEMEETEKLFGS